MISEDDYHYDSLQEGPDTTQNDPSATEPPPLTLKRKRALMLLVVPTILLLMITGLFGFMLVWLLYSHVDFDPSFGLVTNGAIIVDEGGRWCQLLASTVDSHADCNPNQSRSLLGLTLSGLLSKAISFSVSYLMAMAMLCAGSNWLKATSAGEILDMPTPLQ